MSGILLISLLMVPNMVTKIAFGEIYWAALQYLLMAILAWQFCRNNGWRNLRFFNVGLMWLALLILLTLQSLILTSDHVPYTLILKFLPILFSIAVYSNRLMPLLTTLWISVAAIFSLSNWLMTLLFLSDVKLSPVNYSDISYQTIRHLALAGKTTFYNTGNLSQMRFQGWAWEPAASAYFLIFPMVICVYRSIRRHAEGGLGYLLSAALSVLLMSCFIMTRSLGAFTSLSVGVILHVLIEAKWSARRYTFFVKFIAPLIIPAGLALAFVFWDQLWFTLVEKTSLIPRLEQLSGGLSILFVNVQNFFIGVGFDNDGAWYRSSLIGSQTNATIRAFTYFGVLGGAALVGFQLLLLRRTFLVYVTSTLSEERLYYMILATYMIFNQSVDLTFTPVYMVLLFSSFQRRQDAPEVHAAESRDGTCLTTTYALQVI